LEKNRKIEAAKRLAAIEKSRLERLERIR